MSNQSFRNNNPTDIAISKLVGLETYKALYALYPEKYAYISDPLTPTLYFTDLVQGVIASSSLNFESAGNVIYDTLVLLSENPSDSGDLTTLSSTKNPSDSGDLTTLSSTKNINLVKPLINSSYAVENMNFTFWENVIWISIVTFLAFFIIFYLYTIGFFDFLLNREDGIICTDCKSMFDYIIF